MGSNYIQYARPSKTYQRGDRCLIGTFLWCVGNATYQEPTSVDELSNFMNLKGRGSFAWPSIVFILQLPLFVTFLPLKFRNQTSSVMCGDDN